ncbi:MAG TPA: hypothetical protein VIB62_00760 [Actinomycetota bacterium]|jgi:hypothetical protein
MTVGLLALPAGSIWGLIIGGAIVSLLVAVARGVVRFWDRDR